MSATPSKLFLIAMFLALGCVDVSHAQDSSKRMEKFTEKFDAADADHDGFLTRDEASRNMPRIAKDFDAIDTDHDGKLSPQEIAHYFAAKRKTRE